MTRKQTYVDTQPVLCSLWKKQHGVDPRLNLKWRRRVNNIILFFAIGFAASLIYFLFTHDFRSLWVFLPCAIGGAFATIPFEDDTTFEQFTESCSGVKAVLGLSTDDLTRQSVHDLVSRADNSLRAQADVMLISQTAHPPFHPDRVKEEDTFKNRYIAFLNAGLIEDVGYGRYFRKSGDFIPCPEDGAHDARDCH